MTVVDVPPDGAGAPAVEAPPEPAAPERPGDAVEPGRLRPPRAVWLATLLFGLVGAVWTVAVPAYRAPDEPAHLDLVLYLAEGHPYPAFDGRYFGEAMRLDSERHLIDSHDRWPRFDAADAPPRGQRPDVADLGGTTPDGDARHPDDQRAGYPFVYNQMPQHPPLFYDAMAGIVRAERWLLPGYGLPSLDRELGMLRVVNVLLVTPLPLLAWATVRRLGGGDRAGVVASLLPLGLPQLSHICSTLNNDNLLILLGGVLAVLLAGLGRGRRTWRTDVAVGAVLGLSLLTKAFALMFVPGVVAAYALGAWTTRRWRAGALGLAVSGGLGAALGTWWWIANWVNHGEPAPTSETLTHTTAQQPAGFEPDRLGYAQLFVERLLSRTWAWVGFRTPKFELSMWFVWLLTALAAAAVAVAVVRAARGLATGGGPRRWDVALAWAATLCTVVFVYRRAWGLHQTTGGWPFIQGRYLYGTLVAPMAVVGLGVAAALGRRALWAALGLVVGLQVLVLTIVVRGSWSGPGALGSLRGALAWSPWPPAFALAAALGAVAAAVALAAEARKL